MADRSMRVLIVDDEAPARNRLRRILGEIPGVEVVGEAGSGTEAVRLVEQVEPDLLFLDIQMPGLDGFGVLAELPAPPLVIFVTAFDEHAVRAFEIGSCDYLLKPYPRERVAQALERARRQLPPEQPDWKSLLETLSRAAPSPSATPVRVAVREGERIRLLAPEEILFALSEDRVVRIQTATNRFISDETLTALSERLGPGFFRSHRAVLVNLDRVSAIEPWFAGSFRIILDHPDAPRLPLSRRRAKDLREILPF